MGVSTSSTPGDLERGRAGLHVLLVQDGTDAESTLAQVGRDGHHVHVALSWQAALLQALAEVPDVILVAGGVSGKDRRELAVGMQAMEHGPEKWPFIIGISRKTGADRLRGAEDGVDLHLPEPVDLGLLCWVLRRFQRTVLSGTASPPAAIVQ